MTYAVPALCSAYCSSLSSNGTGCHTNWSACLVAFLATKVLSSFAFFSLSSSILYLSYNFCNAFTFSSNSYCTNRICCSQNTSQSSNVAPLCGYSSYSSLSPSLSLGNVDTICFLCDGISCISGNIFWSLGPGCIIVFLFQQFFLHLRQHSSGVVCSLHFHHSYDSPLYVYFGFNTPSYT